MKNADSPAFAHHKDNGVDEPIQFAGLTKREYAAVHLSANLNLTYPEVVDAVDRLFAVLNGEPWAGNEQPAKPVAGPSTSEPPPERPEQYTAKFE